MPSSCVPRPALSLDDVSGADGLPARERWDSAMPLERSRFCGRRRGVASSGEGSFLTLMIGAPLRALQAFV